MSRYLDQLAEQQQVEQKDKVAKLDQNIRAGIKSGMSVPEVVENLQIPDDVKNPNRAVASIAIAQHYNISPERAYGIYPIYKQGLWPDISDEEVVNRLYQSPPDQLPESTVTEQTYEQKAEETLKDFPVYAQKREKAEEKNYPKPTGKNMLKSIFMPPDPKGVEQAQAAAREKARRALDDEWFGKGRSRDLAREQYYDALFEAKTPEEKETATQQYIEALKQQHQNHLKDIDRIEYQIQNHTEDESFMERKALAAKRAGYRAKGTWANVQQHLAKGNPFFTKDREKEFIKEQQDAQREAYAKANAPELWRAELNWIDGVSNSIIENAPTMAMAAGAAAAGGAVGGPVGARAGLWAVTYSAESSEIYQSALERGFSPEEASRRAHMGGVINASLETAGGGVTKYSPSPGLKGKILKYGGKLTKNQLREVLVEEVPQEAVSTILSGNVPYDVDGTVDYSEFTNQMLLVARDAAFTSAFYSSVQAGASNLAAIKTKQQTGFDIDDFTNFDDLMNDVIANGQERDTDLQSKKDAGEYVPGEEKYRLDKIIDHAVKKSIQIPSPDLKKYPYMLVPNSRLEEQAEGYTWHIKNFTDPTNNIKFKSYKEGLAKMQELVPEHVWKAPILVDLEQGHPIEIEEAHKQIQTPDYTEPLEDILNAHRYYLVDEGGNKYGVRDADTSKQVTTGEELDKATRVKNMRNLTQDKGVVSDDPLVQVHRFTRSRFDNGAVPNVYGPISDMLHPGADETARSTAAGALNEYVTGLHTSLAQEFGQVFADQQIPQEFRDSILWLPNEVIYKNKDQSSADTLRHIMRLGQLYGEGAQADQFRNWSRDKINKVKKNKHRKPILSEKDAEPGLWHKLWDPIGGTSKDDFVSSLTHIFGTGHVDVSERIMQARTQTTKYFLGMNDIVDKIQQDLQITNPEKAEWSTVLGRKPKHIPVIVDGQERSMTMAQLIYLDLASRDPSLYNIITNEGIAFKNLDLGPLSETEIVDIHNKVAENQKTLQLANRLAEFYQQDRAEIVNQASRDLKGYDDVTAEHWMPPARKGQSGPLLVQDVFGTVSEDMRTAAHYAGIKPVMRNLQALVNNKNFRRSVQNAGKGRHLKRFQEQLDAMDRSRLRIESDLEKAISRIGANRARAILSNGRIAMLQAGSFQLYQNETDTRYMRPGHVPKQIFDSWDLLQFREKGLGSIHSVVSKNTIRKTWNGRGAVLDSILWPMHKVDLMVVRQAARIAYHEMTDKHLVGKARRWWAGYGKDPHSLKMMSPEFVKALHDRATYLAYSTQPMFFPESRNYYTQHDNVFLREMARFRSFTDQLLRNIGRQYSLWQSGEISNREAMLNMGRTIMWATIWYNGLRFAWDSIFHPDDAKEKDYLLEAILGPLSWIPFIGWPLKTGAASLVSDKAQRYGPANFSTITFDQLNRSKDTAFTLGLAMKYSLNDEKDSRGRWKSEKYWKRGIRDAVRDSLILFFGLPGDAVNIIEDGKDKGKIDITIR